MRHLAISLAVLLLASLPVPAAAVSLFADPDVSLADDLHLLDGGLDGGLQPTGPKDWDPIAFRAAVTEKVLAVLPGDVLGAVARPFIEEQLQLDISQDRAFLRLRLHL